MSYVAAGSFGMSQCSVYSILACSTMEFVLQAINAEKLDYRMIFKELGRFTCPVQETPDEVVQEHFEFLQGHYFSTGMSICCTSVRPALEFVVACMRTHIIHRQMQVDHTCC